MENGEIPEDANERKSSFFESKMYGTISGGSRKLILCVFLFVLITDCPGPQSESAGKSDACEGCPNQEVCATAPKGPDPVCHVICDVAYVSRRSHVLDVGFSYGSEVSQRPRVQTHTRMCFRLLEHCRASLKPPRYVVLSFQMLMNALVKSQNLVSLTEPALTADFGALCLGG
ncbi:hypothetical protein RHSIM_Rhsim10G0010900 [Rhododendron simsii]|uniref:Uncharacterized protein n=1 Tax=Rhododendron simsii TaxID=118357 RepID=A0A834LCW9_RHOSS|nr:hypothetical protein RHSIM_Rhsim10G0010900 [Rhododendron simsii]